MGSGVFEFDLPYFTKYPIFQQPRIDPQEKLTEIQQEISALHKLYSSQPVFGVEYTTEVLKKLIPNTESIPTRMNHPKRRR